MAVYKAITFEGGSLTGTDGFTSASSRASLHTDRPLAGSYSLMMDVNASFSGFNRYEIPSGNRGAIYAAWYTRFYYIPFGNPTMFARLADGSDNSHGYIGIDINGYVRFYEGTGTTPTGDAYGPIIPGEIYRFEWSWVADTGERTLAIAVEDGPATTILDESGLTLPSPVQFHIGAPNISLNDHIVFTMDELLFDDAEIPALGPLNDPAYKGFVGHIGSNATMRRDTQQAYVTLGYRVEWTHDNDYLTYDPSRYDFTVFHYPTQENMATTGPWLRELVDAGYPVLVGTNWTSISNSQTLTSLPGQMRLTGDATGRHPASNGESDAISITDNSHAITAAFATGTLPVYANTGHWLALIPPGTHAGDLLALTDPGGSFTDHYSLIAVEQGDLDLDDEPVGARVVVGVWMYGHLATNQRPYQNGYTADGLALMEAVAQWLMASPAPEPEPTDITATTLLELVVTAEVATAHHVRAETRFGAVAGFQPSALVTVPAQVGASFGAVTGTYFSVGGVAEVEIALGALAGFSADPEVLNRVRISFGAITSLDADLESAARVAARFGSVAGFDSSLLLHGIVAVSFGAAAGFRENYIGPGTGVVTRPSLDPAIIGMLDPTAHLREGDYQQAILPWRGVAGESGIIRILAMTVSDERRVPEFTDVEFSRTPDPASVRVLGRSGRVRKTIDQNTFASRMRRSDRER